LFWTQKHPTLLENLEMFELSSHFIMNFPAHFRILLQLQRVLAQVFKVRVMSECKVTFFVHSAKYIYIYIYIYIWSRLFETLWTFNYISDIFGNRSCWRKHWSGGVPLGTGSCDCTVLSCGT
jgi:hypothetical protein